MRPSPNVYKCRECEAPVALDQKYCLSCGVRRGKLPARIAVIVATIDMPTPPLVAGVPPMPMAPPTAPAASGLLAHLDHWVDNAELPTPRVAALAVMSLLAFGVVMGGLIGPVGGLSPVYVMPSSQPAAVVAPVEEAAAAAEEAVASPEIAELPGEEIAPGPTSPVATPAKVNHVWLIVLSNQGYSKTFGDPTSQSYLTTDLALKGSVVQNYYAVAQGELANKVALVSGQGPTWQQTQNCPNYTDVTPGTVDATTGQVIGDGCVFPETTQTIGDALTSAGKTWGAYIEDIDNAQNGRATACTHPAAGAPDPDYTTGPANAYASWKNPFNYFKSIAANPNCQYQTGGLKMLETDLASEHSPVFSLVIPNRCHDGSDKPCAPGAPSGITSSDDFLRTVVPKIMSSKDYLDGGLIAITFDQAPQGRADSDVSGCCGQPVFPNLAAPTIASAAAAASPGSTGETGETGQTGTSGETSATGPTTNVPTAAPPTYVKTTPLGEPAGGGKVGLLLLSPMIKEGASDLAEDFNHFSLLLSIENWFGTAKLGYTTQLGLPALPDSVFNKTGGE